MANTLLLIHGDSTISDEVGNTVTVTGATVDTTTKKFGAGSISFNGTSNYLTVASNANFNRGSGDFCIEMQVKTSGGWMTLMSRDATSFGTAGNWFFYLQSGDARFFCIDYSGGTALLNTSGSVAINDNAWHHVALIRNGSAWKITVDGIVRASATWAGSLSSVTRDLHIGNDIVQSGDWYNGLIDEIRFSDEAIYTSFPFSPPVNAFSIGIVAVPTSISSTTFGTPSRFNKYVPASISSTSFGTPTAGYTMFPISAGIFSTTIGAPTAAIAFVPRPVRAWAYGLFPSPTFGKPTRRIANTVGSIYTSRLGSPRAILGRYHGTPTSIGPTASFGTPLATSYARFPVAGLISTSFGTPTAKQPTRGVPASIYSTSFGAPMRSADPAPAYSINILTRTESVTIFTRGQV